MFYGLYNTKTNEFWETVEANESEYKTRILYKAEYWRDYEPGALNSFNLSDDPEAYLKNEGIEIIEITKQQYNIINFIDGTSFLGKNTVSIDDLEKFKEILTENIVSLKEKTDLFKKGE